MRKTFLLSLFSIILSCAYAQQGPIVNRDSLLADIVTRLKNIEFMMPDAEQFKLYKTENIHIFLKLNTATGQIDLLQWSLEEGKEFTVALNREDLSLFGHAGTFELYPTQNMFQFILLDKLLGRTWHVQWGIEEEKRWIKRIN